MKVKISFCIPCKNRTHQKVFWDGTFRHESFPDVPIGNYMLKLLPNCLKSIYDSKIDEIEYEVIITDFKSDDTQYEEWVGKALKDISYKIIAIPCEFNRGKGLNIAAEHATGDILFFIDADMLISKEFVLQSTNILSKYKAYFPICKSYKDPLHKYYWVRDTGYGNLIIWRNTFKEYGPWLEREVYGWEDEDIWVKLKDVAHRELGIGFYHQWHPVRKRGGYGGIFSRANYMYDLPVTKKTEEIRNLNVNSGSNPLVSVIIPCYNQEKLLNQAIESVKNQTYSNYEIIVVDDGSPGNVKEVIKNYSDIVYFRQRNKGLNGARNTGIHISKGDYLVFLDADDRLLPDALKISLEYFSRYPECGMVAGNYRWMNEAGNYIDKPESRIIKKNQYLSLLKGNYIGPPGTIMVRKEVFEDIGCFDEKLNGCTDYDIYLRIVKEHAFVHYPDIIFEYRKYNTSMSSDPVKMIKNMYTVFNKQKKEGKKNKEIKEAISLGWKYYQKKYTKQIFLLISSANRGKANNINIAKAIYTLLRYNPRAYVELKTYKIIFMTIIRRVV